MSSQQKNPQAGKQKVPKLEIKIFVEEPERTQGGLFILASAIVTLDQKIEKDHSVQFFLDGLPYGQPSETDENNGRVTEKIRIPNDIRKVSVVAQVVGTGVYDRKIIDIFQEPTKPKPIPTLKVEASGKNGRYLLSVLVTDKDGNPIKGIPVSFAPEDNILDRIEVPTKDNGVAVQPVTITSMERFVLAMVEGAKPERIHLFGPISGPAETTNNGRSMVLWQQQRAQ